MGVAYRVAADQRTLPKPGRWVSARGGGGGGGQQTAGAPPPTPSLALLCHPTERVFCPQTREVLKLKQAKDLMDQAGQGLQGQRGVPWS